MLYLRHQDFNILYLEENIDRQQVSYQQKAFELMGNWLRGQEHFEFTTSGSTGVPKKIVHHRNQMTASARQTLQQLKIDKGSTAVLCINPDFIGGAMVLVRALVGQLNLLMLEVQSNPLQNVDQPFQLISLVPLQLQRILDDNKPEEIKLLKNCDHILLGGAAPSQTLENRLQDWPNHVWSTYGMTETVSHIGLRKLAPKPAEDVFTLIGDTEIDYHKDDQLTVKGSVTNNKWVKTNDRVEIINKNKFRILGRADHVINTGGIKVQPEKIEYLLEPTLKGLGITNFFIAGVASEQYGQEIALLVESETDFDKNQLNNTLRNTGSLNRYEIPKRIIVLPEFQYTTTGKIKKKETLKSAYDL